jgi:hypothetical protein
MVLSKAIQREIRMDCQQKNGIGDIYINMSAIIILILIIACLLAYPIAGVIDRERNRRNRYGK